MTDDTPKTPWAGKSGFSDKVKISVQRAEAEDGTEDGQPLAEESENESIDS